jgi:threo-3-hydroxy-L-aspartate ammonia-lyase
MTLTDTSFTASTGSDVSDGRRRLAGRTVITPVLRSEQLDRLAGAPLWLKAEHLQRGGSFKLRGALLAAERLARAGSRGLVAQSTGNHAVAVAVAAAELGLGLPMVAVLPPDVVPSKVERILATGARVVLSGPDAGVAQRCRLAAAIADAEGLDVVDPYEDADVLAGHGTAVAELLEQMAAAGGRPAAVVVPVGGASALAGACLAAREWRRDQPAVAIIGAEPAAVPSLTAAMLAGEPVTVAARPTIADGLRPDRVGERAYRICRDAGVPVELVSEAEIADALATTLLAANQLVEPAAATGVAVALRLARRDPRWRGRDIGVLLTGGNVDPAAVAQALAGHQTGAVA